MPSGDDGQTVITSCRIGLSTYSDSRVNGFPVRSAKCFSGEPAGIGLDLVWNLPVPYSVANPVAEETGHAEQASAEGRAWMYLESDGDVLPAQGVNQVLGNALTGSLQDLWKMTR